MNRYPILSALPTYEQVAIAERAESGLPTTPDVCRMLGFAPCRLIFTPADGRLTDAQLSALFSGDRKALASEVCHVA